MKKKIFLLIVCSFFIVSFVNAENQINNQYQTAFKMMGLIPELKIIVPTVIDIPISFNDANRSVVVVEELSKKIVPAVVLSTQEKIGISAEDSLNSENAGYLVDDNNDNYVEYPIFENGKTEEVEIRFEFQGRISLSAVSFQLDNNVALPKTIEVTVGEKNEKKIILAKKEIKSRTIFFPETIGSVFFVKLEYSQPLRIREVEFSINEKNFKSMDNLRFLAQPEKNYLVYFDADRYVEINPGEYPDLVSGKGGIMFLPRLTSNKNDDFIKADVDGDGVADEDDNCVFIQNLGQEDIDGNNIGDACDDFDRDGVINSLDNCLNDPNKDQKDSDLDGVGDACDDRDDRFFQSYKWFPTIAIIFVLIVVGGLTIVTIRKK